MNEAHIERLSVIVVMSEAMLGCAQGGEWLALAELEAKRRNLIAVAIPLSPEATEYQQDIFRQILQRVLELDQQIIVLAQAGHTNLAKILQTISVGRSAIQAYTPQVY